MPPDEEPIEREVVDDIEVVEDVEDRPARGRFGGQPGRTAFITGLVAIGFVLVLAPIGIIPGVIIGIAAVVFGVRARRRADRGEEINRRQATWGLITGIAAVVVGGFFIGNNVWYFYFTDEGKELRSCLAETDGDDDAEEACREAADA